MNYDLFFRHLDYFIGIVYVRLNDLSLLDRGQEIILFIVFTCLCHC